MSEQPRIGYIGVGLMGHGAARSLLERGGYPLTICGHRNREPVEDLVRRGAVEAADPVAVAEASDVVFLCVPSSVEVEALMADGLMKALRPGMLLVDNTTADPESTRRLGATLATEGIDMVDAPFGRSPREAEEGRLSTYVGGEPSAIERARPLLDCLADTIVVCGGPGAGHTAKLVNNSIAIGTCAVIAEGLATAAKLGVDMEALARVLSAGGADGRMWRMMLPWIEVGDDSHLKGPMRIAAKDMRFYNRMAEGAGMATPIAQAISQTYRLAVNQGHAERFMPVLPGIIAALNNGRIRDLD